MMHGDFTQPRQIPRVPIFAFIQEICQRQGLRRGPQMFVGATNRFDINQGEIGNCWFLAALANLVENRRAFDRVVPAKQVSTVDIGCCCYKFEMQLHHRSFIK